MNKKFLSAILFGALTAASTSTFVSCKDYDDDIDQLQMQIDQTASTAASDLAAKVAALESQIGTLNAAKEDLASQLAAAKSEAATAAANALAAANGAQASADAAAKDLSNAVARVATLETKLSSLESVVNDLKVAKSELDSKVADLQTQMAAVKADTKANADAIAAANAEILAKYTELNGKISEVSSNIGARIDVIDATLNNIQANYATKDELNTKAQELAAMDAQLKAQIEANLKCIETLQATVKDLASKDAELAAKIESNYNTLIEKINAITVEQTNMQKTIEALQTSVTTLNDSYSTLASTKADKSELANVEAKLATTESNLKELVNTLKESVDASVKVNTAAIEKLQASVETLKQDAANLQKQVDAAATQEALDAAIKDLQTKIDDVAQGAADALAGEIETLKESVEANAADIKAIKEELAKKADQSELDNLVASLVLTQTDVRNITDGLTSIKGDIDNQKAALDAHIAAAEGIAKDAAQTVIDGLDWDERLTDAEELLEQLTGLAGEDLSQFITSEALDTKLAAYITQAEFDQKFKEQKDELAETIKATEKSYTDFKTKIEKEIDDKVKELSNIAEDLVTLQTAVAALQSQVAALINRIQSVAFVPQYKNYNGEVCVPAYYFNPVRDAETITPSFEMKFRIQPADAANKLIAIYANYPQLIKLENSDALQTRAAATEKFEIQSVYADENDLDGYIRVVAKPGANVLVNEDHNQMYPTTLVINGDMTTDENGESLDVNKVNTYKTSEFFNIRPTDLRNGRKQLAENNAPAGMNLLSSRMRSLLSQGRATVNIWYNDFTLYAPNNTLKNVITVNNATGWDESEINHNLVLYAVNDKNGVANTDFAHDDVKGAGWYRFFNVSEKGVQMKQENGVAINDAIEPTQAQVTVYIADTAFGKNNDGSWAVTYAVTYVADPHKLESNMLDKTDKNVFSVAWAGLQSSTTEAVCKTFTFTKDEFTKTAAELAEYGYDETKLFNELCAKIESTDQTSASWNNNYYKVVFTVNKKDGKYDNITATVTRKTTAIYGFDSEAVKTTATFGNAYFTVNFDFAGTFNHSDDFYMKAAERWADWTSVDTEAKVLSVNFNWDDVKNTTGTYNYSIDMAGAYTHMSKYIAANMGCTYNFELLPHTHTVGSSNMDASTIAFVGGKLNVYAPIKDESGCALSYDDVKFKLTVKDNNGTEMVGKKGEENTINNIKLVLPLSNNSFAIKGTQAYPTTDLGKMNAGETVKVSQFVNLTSTANQQTVPFIKEGVLQTTNEVKPWNVSSIKYKATSIKTAAGEVLPGNISLSQDGELKVADPGNITLDVTVTIKVTVTYQFDTVSTTYTVTIPKQI